MHLKSEAQDLYAAALGRLSEERTEEIGEQWETRLAWPVLIAAIVSVPSVFLTLFDEPFEMIGHVGLWGASVVLVVETVVLFLVSPKKVDWVRRNWWLILLTALTIIATIFSIGPMQILRMLRSVGALRVLRAKQVAKAGESLQKSGGSAWKRYLGSALAIIVVGAFVIAALADPESPARNFLEGLFGEEGAIAASIGAGVVIMGLMFLLVRPDKSSQNE